MREFFLDLERWPISLSTIVEAFWQMFMAPWSIVLGTILCSFRTCQSRQGFHLRFRLIFCIFCPSFLAEIYVWVSKFLSVVRWSQGSRWFMPIWDNVALHWTRPKGADMVSRAETRWRDLWLLHTELGSKTIFIIFIMSFWEKRMVEIS